MLLIMVVGRLRGQTVKEAKECARKDAWKRGGVGLEDAGTGDNTERWVALIGRPRKVQKRIKRDRRIIPPFYPVHFLAGPQVLYLNV